MDENELIVSKTDLKGIITYGNEVFCNISDYKLSDVLGKPHNIVRNPNMPRCMFKLIWDTLGKGDEIFAYVINAGKNGDHYWVLAHITPNFDDNNEITGYHSSRRNPSTSAVSYIKDLYSTLLKEENKESTEKKATDAGFNKLSSILNEKGVNYEEFVLSL